MSKCKIKKCGWSCFFTVVCVIFSLPSLFSQSNPENQFYRHFIAGKEQLAALYEMRSISFSCDYIPGEDQIVEELQYCMQTNRGGKRALLYYFHEVDTLYAYLITSSRFLCHTRKISKEELLNMEATLKQSFRVEILAMDRSPQKRGAKLISEPLTGGDVKSATDQLSELLFPSVFHEELLSVKNLIIQPSFNIGQIPFAALQPFGNEAYLIDSMSYSLCPHLCNLFSISKKEFWNQKLSYRFEHAFLVGNPDYYQGDYYFPALPGAEEEVLQVHKTTGGNVLIGKDAVMSKVLQGASEADFLYFATHGIADPDNPLNNSFLAFTPDQSSKNGYWTAKDIQQSTLSAELAVLSACQTGAGRIVDAGFIGLGRAFFKAGVPNTLMSLWNVDDEATKNLMLFFIKELQTPDYFFPSSQLRKAMLKQKALTPDPIYWAPFVVFGFGY